MAQLGLVETSGTVVVLGHAFLLGLICEEVRALDPELLLSDPYLRKCPLPRDFSRAFFANGY